MGRERCGILRRLDVNILSFVRVKEHTLHLEFFGQRRADFACKWAHRQLLESRMPVLYNSILHHLD